MISYGGRGRACPRVALPAAVSSGSRCQHPPLLCHAPGFSLALEEACACVSATATHLSTSTEATGASLVRHLQCAAFDAERVRPVSVGSAEGAPSGPAATQGCRRRDAVPFLPRTYFSKKHGFIH